MPNSRRYVYLHKGDNEWLSEPPLATSTDSELEEWNKAWAYLKKETPHPIEFTEDMYLNSEYGETPEWVDIHIQDDMILNYKMARGIIKSLEGARHIAYSHGFVCDVSSEWGGIGHETIAISDTGAWVTIHAKHSSEEIELDITEQFNQAIGE